MRSVSDAFTAAVAAPHQLAVRAYILDGDTSTEVPVTDGSVTSDATAATRSSCDLTISDDGSLGWVPDSPTSALAPYGNEVRVYRGITLPDGEELVSLGIFRLNDVDVDDNGAELSIRISGQDRSARLIDAKFEDAYQIASGTAFDEAISDTLSAAYPDIETNFATTAATTPLLLAEAGDDRWDFCQQLAAAIGMELYFDGDGVCVLRPIPSTDNTDPVATIAEGADGVLISASRRWTREGAFNKVIATGENSGETPVRGEALDDNPLSPTYYYGAFGPVPTFWNSPYITTEDQADDAARGKLARELGTTQSVNFGAIANPALEVGDVVTITRSRTGIDEAHVLDQLTYPLGLDAMSGQTRATQVT